MGCTSILGDFHETSSESTGQDGSSGSGSDSSMSSDAPSGPHNEAGGPETGPGDKPIGAKCLIDLECNSRHCADFVCCESACNGTCETCNLAGGTPGMCEPVPANTDPQLECVTAPATDAGPLAGQDAGDAGNTGDAAVTGGDATAVASDASLGDATVDATTGATTDATVSDAPHDGALAEAAVAFDSGGANIGYNVPEGGVMIHQAVCAGSCNGARACQFPDATKACGTQFCNTSSQQGSFVCDGTGNCGLVLQSCTDYACENSVCGTDSTASCSGPSDCLDTAYCTSSNKCAPKKQDSVGCTLPTECESGYCSGGVCCNSACDPSSVPGGTCTAAGKVGACTCPMCTTGPCAVFYRDYDGDGQGDPNLLNSKVACAGSTQMGYVTNNTDCDDNNANAFVGQTAYFSTPRQNGSYDYNCDGMNTGTPDVHPGASCGFCGGGTSACGITSYACTSTGTQSYIDCYVGFCRIPIDPPIGTIGTIQAQSLIVGSAQPDLSICGGCYGNESAGFTGTAACGQQAAYLYCGTCSGSTGSPYSDSYTQPFPCH